MTIILQGLRSAHVIVQGYRAEVTERGVTLVKVAPPREVGLAPVSRDCDVLARFVKADVISSPISAAVIAPHKRMVLNA